MGAGARRVVVAAGRGVVVTGGRGAERARVGRRGAPNVDRFRAERRRPAQNPLIVSRQVALVVAAVLGPPQRALELVHQPVVELVEGARAAGLWGRRAGTFAGGLEGALGGAGGSPREVPAAQGHGAVRGRGEKVRPRGRRQRWALGLGAFRDLQTEKTTTLLLVTQLIYVVYSMFFAQDLITIIILIGVLLFY